MPTWRALRCSASWSPGIRGSCAWQHGDGAPASLLGRVVRGKRAVPDVPHVAAGELLSEGWPIPVEPGGPFPAESGGQDPWNRVASTRGIRSPPSGSSFPAGQCRTSLHSVRPWPPTTGASSVPSPITARIRGVPSSAPRSRGSVFPEASSGPSDRSATAPSARPPDDPRRGLTAVLPPEPRAQTDWSQPGPSRPPSPRHRGAGPHRPADEAQGADRLMIDAREMRLRQPRRVALNRPLTRAIACLRVVWFRGRRSRSRDRCGGAESPSSERSIASLGIVLGARNDLVLQRP